MRIPLTLSVGPVTSCWGPEHGVRQLKVRTALQKSKVQGARRHNPDDLAFVRGRNQTAGRLECKKIGRPVE